MKGYVIDTIHGYRYNGDTVARVKMSWYDIKGEANYYTLRGYAETELTVPYYDSEKEEARHNAGFQKLCWITRIRIFR